MGLKLTNKAISRLGSSLTSGATTLSVTSGEGARFPTLGAGDWFPIMLIKDTGAYEVVRCTARSGDVLTIERAQEGTASQAFSTGDRVELRLTAAAVAEIVQMVSDITAAAALKAQNLADLPDKVSARANLQLGTAALANVQTSASDATANALMAVGAFGLGGPAITAADLSLIAASGFYQIGAGTLNEPSGVDSGSTCIHLQYDASNAQQMVLSRTTNRVYFRRKSVGTWSSWFEHYTQANVSTLIASLLDDTNEAEARTTLGVPAVADVVAVTDKRNCTAWVNFIGSGGVSIRDSYNVSSITDVGVGKWIANFTAAMANANYAAVITAAQDDLPNRGILPNQYALTTGGFSISTENTGGGSIDAAIIHAAVFGGK